MDVILKIRQLIRQGKLKQAHAVATKGLKKDKANAELNRLMGVINLQNNRLSLAERHFLAAKKCAPENAMVQINLASLYVAQNDHDRAEQLLLKVIDMGSHDVVANYNLANLYSMTQKWDLAKKHYEITLSLEPNHLSALYNFGLLLKNNAQADEAIAHFKKSLSINPNQPRVYWGLANLKKYVFDAREKEHVELILKQGVSKNDEIHMGFTMAKILKDEGQYESSFEYLKKANQLKKLSLGRKAKDWMAYGEKVIQSFPKIVPVQASQSRHTTPVFIVSMPRAGSTLVEQILASHSQVSGAAELPYVKQAITKVDDVASFPENFDTADDSIYSAVAEDYHSQIGKWTMGKKILTDKQMDNYQYLGVILKAMPEAKVIHCRRHPLDVFLSCYEQLFAHGHEYTYDAKEWVSYYQQVERVMDHWKSLCADHITELNYEDLVQKPVDEIERLLSFLGLDFEPACLNFHQTKRNIRTASAGQVTQKMYTQSMYRYKNYGNSLDFVKKLLASG